MFHGGGWEVVDSLSIVAPIVCFKGIVFGPCFYLQYFVSPLVLQSSC